MFCRTSFIAVAGLAAFLSMSVQSARAADVVLRYSNWLPAGHHVNVDIMFPWFEKIKEVTEGRVEVEVLPKVVGTPATQFDVISDGLADIGYIVPGYSPGRFRAALSGELAFIGDNAAVYAPIFDRLYREYFVGLDEFRGVELMALASVTGGHVFTANRAVEQIEDFQGLKLRTSGSVVGDFVTALGGVPIVKSITDAYEMLTTGSIDGALLQYGTTVDFKLAPMINHVTMVPGGIFHGVVAVIVNPASWDRISNEDKEAILAISHSELASVIGQSYQRSDDEAQQTMREMGHANIIEASPEFIEDLGEVFAPIEAKWVAETEAKGAERVKEFIAELRRAVAEAESQNAE